MRLGRGVPLLISAALIMQGCAVNPATGSRQLMLVSESQEIALGREYDQEVTASIGVYADSGLQRYIQQFGARLAATSERPNLPWSFRVVDDPVVNAFALPGGYIYVARDPGALELRGRARRRGRPRDRPRHRAPLRQPDEQTAARADPSRRRYHREPGVRALRRLGERRPRGPVSQVLP